jgi:hypothetical protein
MRIVTTVSILNLQNKYQIGENNGTPRESYNPSRQW